MGAPKNRRDQSTKQEPLTASGPCYRVVYLEENPC
jgi:hypothetical protein